MAHGSARRRVRLGTLLVLGLVSVASSASAGQSADASIIGQIRDESGAVLPGVTVTVTGPALPVARTDISSTNGDYRVTPLPLGTYVVEYALQGFQTVRREGVRLTAGFVAKIDAELKVGALAESVTVTGDSPIVDVTNTSARTVVTQEVLEAIPTGRNSLSSLLTLAPGSRTALDVGKVSGQNPAFRAFGRSNNSWTTIDGITTTAPWSGASGFSNNFNYESIEEATVQTVGSSAESPTSGIQLSVISKSGGNDFHGKALVGQFFRGWQSNNLDDELRSFGIPDPPKTLTRWDRGGELGGRIKRDKIWFYGSARVRKDAETLLGSVKPDGEPNVDLIRETMYVSKVTGQLNASQKVIGAFHFRNRHDEGGPTADLAPESGSVHDLNTMLGKGEWQMAQGNRVLSVVSGFWASLSPEWIGLSNIPDSSDQVTGLKWGVEDKANTETHIMRYDSKATLNWFVPDLFKGSHDLKTGVQFTVARGDFFTHDRGEAGNYKLIYRSLVPFQVQVLNAPVQPHTRLDYLAAYFQDSWTISRRLTLNLGVRVGRDHGWLPEQCREAAPAPFSGLYPDECYAESHLKILNTVAPRLHAAYDLTGDSRTVLKGGWGRFYNMRTQDQMNLANPLSDSLTSFRWNDLNRNGRFDAGESNLSLSGSDFVSRSVTINQNLSGLVDNPDLKNAGTDEFSLTIERQLGSTYAVRATGVYVKDFNTARVLNTLRPYDAYNIPITNPDPGPDGRLGTADDTGRSVTYYDYSASLAGAAFQRLMFVNDDASDRSYRSFELAASRRLTGRWQFMAAVSATKFNVPFVDETTGASGNGNQRGVFSTSLNPNAEIFARNTTWEWNSIMGGSYVLPLDVQFSANYEVRSGEVWARTVSFSGGQQIPSLEVRVEPIGSQRTDTQHILTLRAQKSFQLPAGQRATFGVQVYNGLNGNFIDCGGNTPCRPSLRTRAGSTFGQPTAIVSPRKAEIVMTYTF